MSLDEQVNTIERALGERMLNHAFIILRQWVKELGFGNYQDRIATLEQNYRYVFDYYLTTDDPDRDELLDKMTSEAYMIADEIYADIRLLRGVSPQMHGFNVDNPQSVMHYFAACVHLQEEDYRWFREVIQDEERQATALVAIAALSTSLRECFSLESMMCMVEAAGSPSDIVAHQAMASLILLLAHYDVRIDFFPSLQDAFMTLIDGNTEHAFQILCSVIRAAKTNLRDLIASGEVSEDDLPEALRELIAQEGNDDGLQAIVSWMPDSERDYIVGIVSMLPQTWVFDVLVGEDADRQQEVNLLFLSNGHLERMLDSLPTAEQWLLERLRSQDASPTDYINYGHCCLLRGDRMMAYESYRQARTMCSSLKMFYSLFRPDRRMLVDCGVPVEQVYLIEDQLLHA